MARIRSKAGLIKYIKSQLGAPLINIEVTNGQMSEIIDDTIQKFTEYAYGTLEGTVMLTISGAKDYAMPDTMTNIINLSRSTSTNFESNFGGGYVPDLWSEQYFNGSTGIESIVTMSNIGAIISKYIGNQISYNFNHLNKKLQVFENYSGIAFLHYEYEYIADELNDLVYNHEWVKAYCIAKTKFLWGSVTGKFASNLVGGATINYSDMKSESEQSIAYLNEELLDKWSDPAPIDIG